MGSGAGNKNSRKRSGTTRKAGNRSMAPRDREATRNMTAKERQKDRQRRRREAGIPERTREEAIAQQRRAKAWFDSFR